MSDANCPYCNYGQEICHDDGYGFQEDEKYEQHCGNCSKNFVYTPCIEISYDTAQADCLNGSDHDYHPTSTYPKKYFQMMCSMCDNRRKPTQDEFESHVPMEERA